MLSRARCRPHPHPHQNQSVYSGFWGPSRSCPLPSAVPLLPPPLGCGSDVPGKLQPQSPRPDLPLCLELSFPGSHGGSPPPLQVWVLACLLFSETVIPGHPSENHREHVLHLPDSIGRMWLGVSAASVGTVGVLTCRCSGMSSPLLCLLGGKRFLLARGSRIPVTDRAFHFCDLWQFSSRSGSLLAFC